MCPGWTNEEWSALADDFRTLVLMDPQSHLQINAHNTKRGTFTIRDLPGYLVAVGPATVPVRSFPLDFRKLPLSYQHMEVHIFLADQFRFR
jgi:hypothetical protein